MSTPFFFGAAGDDIVDRILRQKAAEAQAGRDLVQAIQAPAPTPTPTPTPAPMMAAAPVMPTPLPPVMPTPGPMMAAPTPTPTPMPKPAAPAPTQVQPLRDSQFEDVRSGASSRRAAAAAPLRRSPIRVVRGGGQGGTDLYTNIGTAGDVVVDNGESVGPDVGVPGRGGTVEYAQGPRYVSDAVLENGARQAAQLDTERLIERLQAGPGVGAAPATAGEQLEDSRRTADINALAADRDNELANLQARFAAREISPEAYIEARDEMRRAWAEDASAHGARIDPRFFTPR